MSKQDKDQGRKVSGGSVTLERRGLVRGGGENAMAPTPEALCVIDGPNPGDLSEAQIRALYKGDKRAQEVITAILDKQRAQEPAPEYFWHTCRDGIIKAVQYVDLGEGSDGISRLPIADGRHRKDSAVKVIAERAAVNDPRPFLFPTLNVPIPADPMKAAEIVRRIKTVSNIHVAMAPSHQAARAFEHYAGGAMSYYAVGVTIGLRAEVAEQEVPRLLALAMCIEEVQMTVNADPTLLPVVGKWRSVAGEMIKSPAQQREWLAARLAPPKARVVSAVKRPTSKRLDAFADALLVHSGQRSAIFQAIGLARGALKLTDVTDEAVRHAWAVSEGAHVK